MSAQCPREFTQGVSEMPELDFAFLCQAARIEGGLVHVLAGAADTVMAPEVPTGQNFALVVDPCSLATSAGGRIVLR
jgi:hypothetical protein